MAVKSTNTQAEVITGIIQDLAYAKTLPDADIPFLTDIETQLLQYTRQPVQNVTANAQTPPSPFQPGPGGGGPSVGPSMGPSMPPGASAGQNNMPPVDELRRVLGA